MTKRVFDHYKTQHDLTYTLAPTAPATPEPAPTPEETSEPRHWIWDYVILCTGGLLATVFWTVYFIAMTYGGRL